MVNAWKIHYLFETLSCWGKKKKISNASETCSVSLQKVHCLYYFAIFPCASHKNRCIWSFWSKISLFSVRTNLCWSHFTEISPKIPNNSVFLNKYCCIRQYANLKRYIHNRQSGMILCAPVSLCIIMGCNVL